MTEGFAVPVAAAAGDILRPQQRTQTYAADLISTRATLVGILCAALGAGVLTLGSWLVFKHTSLPAFNTSMITRALATVGISATLLLTAGLLGWWLMDESPAGRLLPRVRPRWRRCLTYVVSYLSPAMLVVCSLGVPLAATRLWLDGIQVDQAFRTQFLTRTADQLGYADMNYLDLPTYYPLGWFWLAGRLAQLLHLPGWAVFQPWALISLAVAGAILVPVWQRLCGSLPVATGIALTTVAVTLTIAAAEPYSAVIAMGVPAVAVLCARAFRGSWAASIGIMLFLGVSATFYTLYTGVVSLPVVALIAVVVALYQRRIRPLLHLTVIGFGALAIAALAWGPYVLAAVRHSGRLESAAQHYLPLEGTQVPVPFLAPSVIGVLCLIGLIYLVLRVTDPELLSLFIALGGVYGWILVSMLMTLAGTTLLGFRLEVVVVLIMATAGVLALADLRLIGVHNLYPARFDVPTNRAITWAFVVVLLLGGLYFAQQIPQANEAAIDHAYSDTDGSGVRADRYQPDSARFFGQIDDLVQQHGHTPRDTVVLTDEVLFMAFHPYHGFNAFTAHYANPLGEFTARNKQIEQWAAQSWDSSPAEFRQLLDGAKWKAPEVLIFRGSLPGDQDGSSGQSSGKSAGKSSGNSQKSAAQGLKIHLAEDIYPNLPNVRYRAVFFSPKVFEQGWEVKQIGPFVVAVRTA